MKTSYCAIPDIILLEPTIVNDERGHLFESFNQKVLEGVLGRSVNFVQENQSQSVKNVLRGMHYQIKRPQAKLVRVVSGAVFDVAVDMRSSSPTFGKWVGEVLSEKNNFQMWIPEGFAHGFLVLTQSAQLLYKMTEYWWPDLGRSVRWDDPDVAIDWPVNGIDPVLSPKDARAGTFTSADPF